MPGAGSVGGRSELKAISAAFQWGWGDAQPPTTNFGTAAVSAGPSQILTRATRFPNASLLQGLDVGTLAC